MLSRPSTERLREPSPRAAGAGRQSAVGAVPPPPMAAGAVPPLPAPAGAAHIPPSVPPPGPAERGVAAAAIAMAGCCQSLAAGYGDGGE